MFRPLSHEPGNGPYGQALVASLCSEVGDLHWSVTVIRSGATTALDQLLSFLWRGCSQPSFAIERRRPGAGEPAWIDGQNHAVRVSRPLEQGVPRRPSARRVSGVGRPQVAALLFRFLAQGQGLASHRSDDQQKGSEPEQVEGALFFLRYLQKGCQTGRSGHQKKGR